MKKLKMSRGVTLTFEEGCNKYLENCRQRNLREGTIRHYRQSYLHFYKYFDPKMPVEDIAEQTHKDYVLHLKATLHNDVSINYNLLRRRYFVLSSRANYLKQITFKHIDVGVVVFDNFLCRELLLDQNGSGNQAHMVIGVFDDIFY